jgi:hypothetical protein
LPISKSIANIFLLDSVEWFSVTPFKSLLSAYLLLSGAFCVCPYFYLYTLPLLFILLIVLFYFNVMLFRIDDALTVDYWDGFFLKSDVYVFFGGRYLAFIDDFAYVVGLLLFWLSLFPEEDTFIDVASIADDLFSPDELGWGDIVDNLPLLFALIVLF